MSYPSFLSDPSANKFNNTYIRDNHNTGVALDITGDSIIRGKTYTEDNVEISGNIIVHNNVDISGNTSIKGTLYGDSNTNELTLDGTLKVTGDLKGDDISNELIMNGDFKVLNDVTINGDTIINGTTNIDNLFFYKQNEYANRIRHINDTEYGIAVTYDSNNSSGSTIVNANSGYVTLRINQVEKLTVHPNGNVGIGTTNPIYGKLSIQGLGGTNKPTSGSSYLHHGGSGYWNPNGITSLSNIGIYIYEYGVI